MFRPREVQLIKAFEAQLKASAEWNKLKAEYATKVELNLKADQSALSGYQPAGNYATTDQLDLKADITALNNYQPKGDYVLKTELGEGGSINLSNYQPKGDYALKSDLSIYAKIADLGNYALKTELNAKVNSSELVNYALKSELEDKVDSSVLVNYSTKEDLNLKADKGDLNKYQEKGDYATKTEVSLKADATALDGYQVKGNYATVEQLNTKADTTALDGYQVKGEYALKTDLNTKADATDLSNYQLKGNYVTEEDAKTRLQGVLNQAKEYADNKVRELIGGAPESLDTLKEIADILSNNQSGLTDLIERVNKLPKMKVMPVGDGSSKTLTIKHDLGTKSISCSLWTNTENPEWVFTDIKIIDENNVQVDFGEEFESAPIENAYNLVILAQGL